MAYLLVLFIGFVLASLPFISERILGVWALESGKSTWLRLGEWCVLFGVFLVVALGIEKRMQGTIHAQDWEFYVVVFFLFSVFAVPGFVWRYIWLARTRAQR